MKLMIGIIVCAFLMLLGVTAAVTKDPAYHSHGGLPVAIVAAIVFVFLLTKRLN